MKERRQKKRFSNIFWGRKRSSSKEQPHHKRFAVAIPAKLEAIAPPLFFPVSGKKQKKFPNIGHFLLYNWTIFVIIPIGKIIKMAP
jgi:hypothetical protein